MAVRVERDGAVYTVVLDRPQVRNAVDREHAEALADAFRAFEESDAAVAVLFGAGGTFCAGADLKAFSNRFEPDGDGPMGPTRMLLSKPVIAAVSGYAVAGGLELALWCDLRVADEDAVFGVFNRRFGVPLVDGGTVLLPRLLGLSRAVAAEEALAIGLANRVVPSGTSRPAAEELARQLVPARPSSRHRVEPALDHREAFVPEARVAEIDAEDPQQRFGRVGPAGGEEALVACAEPGLA